jgi:hypothetical protein
MVVDKGVVDEGIVLIDAELDVNDCKAEVFGVSVTEDILEVWDADCGSSLAIFSVGDSAAIGVVSSVTPIVVSAFVVSCSSTGL